MKCRTFKHTERNNKDLQLCGGRWWICPHQEAKKNAALHHTILLEYNGFHRFKKIKSIQIWSSLSSILPVWLLVFCQQKYKVSWHADQWCKWMIIDKMHYLTDWAALWSRPPQTPDKLNAHIHTKHTHTSTCTIHKPEEYWLPIIQSDTKLEVKRMCLCHRLL